MKINAAIEEPAVIAKILAHLGLPTRAPPQANVYLTGIVLAFGIVLI